MKKFSSLLLALGMTACLLCGCGREINNTTDDDVKVNYHTISLISYTKEVMLKILHPRLQQYMS